MKKFIPIFIAVLLAAVIGVWVLVSNQESQNTNPTAVTTETVHVGTSFYVLDEFVRTIGGEHVEVVVSPPAGIDVHSFEPTARQVADLQSVDLFLFQGAGVDSWAEDIATELEETGVTVLEMNEHISLRATDEEDRQDEEHENEEMHEEDGHEHSEFDPHTWLDPVLAQTMVDEVRAALTELDPEHASEYQKNADALQQQLASLDTQYERQLANCSIREIIVAHDAFEYVGARYDIEMHAIAGVSPEEEPSAKKLAELTVLAREHGINYIFFEALTSPKTAETIANEVGAQTLVLDPIEGISSNEQRGYIEIMQDNLQNLQTGMDCSQ